MVTRLLPHMEERAQTDDLWWVALHIQARHALYRGDAPREEAAELERWIALRRALVKPSSFVGQRLRADLADLYRAAGKLAAAEHVLETPGLDVGRSVTLASRMRAELLRGDPSKALEHFDGTVSTRGARAVVYPHWQALVMTAAQHHSRDLTTKCVKRVVAAIEGPQAFVALVEVPEGPHATLLGMFSAPVPPIPQPYPAPRARPLTPRGKKVLDALRQHHTAAEIPAVLHVSPNTVKTQLRTLYAKLGVHSRAETLRAAPQLGNQ